MDDLHSTIAVEARVIGQRLPLQTRLPVDLSHLPDGFCLRDLLALLVREEVRSFELRQQERRLLRVLGPREIADAAARGKVSMGGPNELRPGQAFDEVDEEAAVATALQAFEDGLYFVFLDGQQIHSLDATLTLHATSTLKLIRLVALAGG